MVSTAVQPERFPWFDYSGYSFSLGIDTGEGVYLSGHTASVFDDQAGRITIKGSMAEQACTAYDTYPLINNLLIDI